MPTRNFFIVAAFALLLPAGVASAQEVEGDVVTVAAGTLSEAEASIQSVGDRAILNRNVDLRVRTQDVVTISNGFFSRACAAVGSIDSCHKPGQSR